MMEKAVKQRLVGGLVLIAGAALFLPMLLDGAGSELVVPEMPAAPQVAGVEALQPQLEKDIKVAGEAIDEAQAGPVFHEVAPPASAPAVEDTPPDESYALAEAPVTPAQPTVTADARSAADKASAATVAALTASGVSAEKADAERLAREKAARESAEKERQARLEAERKALEARKKAELAAKPVASATPAPVKPAASLPEAWVVQVASLSARDKADELVARLRAKGYRATLVHQSGMWKVLVGPELRKEVADSIKQRLAADPELRLAGWVQAWKP
ncbi:MAG: SPOR domain-containing protein [Gammaproteobacteria bacterium]